METAWSWWRSRNLSYDAMTAHTAVVFTRYMMLSLESRESNDNRSLGGSSFYTFLTKCLISHGYRLFKCCFKSMQKLLYRSFIVKSLYVLIGKFLFFQCYKLELLIRIALKATIILTFPKCTPVMFVQG